MHWCWLKANVSMSCKIFYITTRKNIASSIWGHKLSGVYWWRIANKPNLSMKEQPLTTLKLSITWKPIPECCLSIWERCTSSWVDATLRLECGTKVSQPIRQPWMSSNNQKTLINMLTVSHAWVFSIWKSIISLRLRIVSWWHTI